MRRFILCAGLACCYVALACAGFAAAPASQPGRALGPQKELIVAELIQLLHDPQWGVRERAARTLGETGPAAHAAIAALTERLRDPEPLVRGAAARALGQIGPAAQGAAVALAELLREDHRTVGIAAAEALGMLGPAAAPAVPPIMASLRDHRGHVRQRAAEALGGIGPAAGQAIGPLTDMLADPEPAVRIAAAEGLIGVHRLPGDAVPALRRLLQDPHPGVRKSLAETLGRINPDGKQRPVLVKKATGSEGAKNGAPQPEKSDELLESAGRSLQDANRRLEDAEIDFKDACEAELRLSALDTIPVLRQLLADPHPLVRGSAAEALGYAAPLPETIVTWREGLAAYPVAKAARGAGPTDGNAKPTAELIKEDRLLEADRLLKKADGHLMEAAERLQAAGKKPLANADKSAFADLMDQLQKARRRLAEAVAAAPSQVAQIVRIWLAAGKPVADAKTQLAAAAKELQKLAINDPDLTVRQAALGALVKLRATPVNLGTGPNLPQGANARQ